MLSIWLKFWIVLNRLKHVWFVLLSFDFPSLSTYGNHVFWVKIKNISKCRTLPGIKWAWLNSAHFKLYHGTKDIMLQGVTKYFQDVFSSKFTYISTKLALKEKKLNKFKKHFTCMYPTLFPIKMIYEAERSCKL